MSETIALNLNFRPRMAASELRQQLLDYLTSTRPEVGERLLTEAELVGTTKLSRSTVRRALDELQRDGWIERRIGQGTFVGPRVAMAAARPARPVVKAGRAAIRLAVLIFEIGDLAHDWYTPLVLEGLDLAAEEHGISVELLGNRDRDVDAISRRMLSGRPDVLACLAAEPRQAFVIRDAQKLGIPCLVTGTPHLDLNLPTVCEDNRHGMRLAVEHLVSLGHRRIGMTIQRKVERWVFDRHEAFLAALADARIEPDEGMVHWVAMDEPRQGTAAWLDAMERYLVARRPTAVVSASYLPMLYLDRLVRQRRLAVPGDLSLVSFEQNVRAGDWLGGLKPAVVRLPLHEMGRKLAEMARLASERVALPHETYLPCSLVAGDTVISANRAGG